MPLTPMLRVINVCCCAFVVAGGFQPQGYGGSPSSQSPADGKKVRPLSPLLGTDERLLAPLAT